MESVPTPASPRIPTSQQEAQDAVLRYLQKTVDGLPPGTVLDSTDFRGGGNVPCDDNFTGPGKPPTEYEYWTHVMGPPGASSDELVAATGEVWRSWGLTVVERDDFRKPNRFGYAPDSYRLQIKGPGSPGFPPTLIVSSPCFPGNLVRDDIPAPSVIKRTATGS
ncbi:Uncharacterised protein [Mycobacteroides abscessus subsp. abscessus]|nr:Uncharacterised protein [Mycobacteroides abscessus subsp. abscessus]SHQ50807.1 Uncharacterised protein [Mycobacteroides abscessus subsp. abscessus]SHQ51857.1 Uncharacterised protein [Mycobacteroides abscessus subsp. abscessus]SHS76552.1 Uncharacterised protein [Mycobacteroides abscessus subsp. abscessus]SHT52631.1 Uncharacterised protein [Mycobacteroides abscessus subsp. abscessus]